MTTQISGTAGVTFPAGGVGNPAGAVVGTTDSQTLTNKTLGSGLVAGASYLTSGTSQASTSGTSITFSSIPSWVKRITVMFQGVSTNGTSIIIVRVGSGSLSTTGYLGSGGGVVTGGQVSNSQTVGFPIDGDNAAVRTYHGQMVLTNISSNNWVSFGSYGLSDQGRNTFSGGSISLSGTLDRVAITTINGTDTFDAGSINILYE